MSAECGIVGLAVMGSNLALNIAEKGFKVAVFNRTYSKTVDFLKRAGDLEKNLCGFENMKDFVAAIKPPRKVFILVQAGAATEATIKQLKEVLSKDDIIVDTGNAHYKDQARRAEELEAMGLRFLGMGISGGEEGARKGPAFFPGGTLSVWAEIKTVIEAAAAKAEDGRPCVTMNGKGGAGSCVKMFHNAGEYAILQLWGEVCEFLSNGGLSHSDVADVLTDWKKRGYLTSYMLDITIEVMKAKDDKNPSKNLTEFALDKIGSKGTGLWSAQEALDVGCPAPTLCNAVIARQFTTRKDERQAINKTGIEPTDGVSNLKLTKSSPEVEQLYHAVKLSMIASYAQMFQALRQLDEVHKFGINLPATIATFRAGCILAGFLLQPMTEAFEKDPNIPNLMCAFQKDFKEGLVPMRQVIGKALTCTSLSLPCMTASLSYINAMATPILRYAQVVSLQRDVFGRHGYERIDEEGRHNHKWPELQ